ncbi:HlyU family transcriptional regulator [Tabrizicola sp. YIM 78059]|uniref:HlyU family transcriptional regulator n=1 Tax=Tabrizicola sp. YIM 78059 TaxID=2529861 RepID=UPI0010AAA538|nr:HlyU family transcriptional regulator [Tabrizicola sp. YIM 78059]
MSLLSRLFGRKSADPAPESRTEGEDYKGYRIVPRPIREGGQFRVAARIEKDGRGHDLIRADTMASAEQAAALSVAKARQMIDEQGDRLFG